MPFYYYKLTGKRTFNADWPDLYIPFLSDNGYINSKSDDLNYTTQDFLESFMAHTDDHTVLEFLLTIHYFIRIL